MNVLQNVKGSFIRGNTPSNKPKCMSCGQLIETPMPGPDGRRFCSEKCKKEYFG